MTVEVEHVSVRYDAVTALDDMSLTVAPGQVVGILGINGAGKSSLLRAIAGVGRVSSGTIRVDGKADRTALRAACAFAPDSGGVYPIAAERTGRLFGDVWPGFDVAAFEGWLDRLQVPRGRPGTTLSRGQAARLRLATVLSRPGDVLLLDEPLGGIDPASRDRIAEALALHLAETGRTTLVATHEVTEVEPLLERVVVIEDGRVAWDEEADALRARTGRSVDLWLRRRA